MVGIARNGVEDLPLVIAAYAKWRGGVRDHRWHGCKRFYRSVCVGLCLHCRERGVECATSAGR
jgi:hypothetical protein